MKNSKLFSLFFLLLIFGQTVRAQQKLKSYSGAFKLRHGIENSGKAQYSYYEDNSSLERVKQGVFRYTANFTNSIQGAYSEIISGQFNKGFKNGVWSYNKTYNDFNRNEGNSFMNATGSVNLTANYLNGLPNGEWVFRKRILSREKRYVFGKLMTGSFGLASELNMKISFRNGLLCGPLNITSSNRSITGSFDSEGRLDGHWVLRTSSNEEITDYAKGVVIRRINRSLPNGEIIESEVDDPQTKKIKQDFIHGTISETQLEEAGYSISRRNIFKDRSVNLESGIFNDDDFRYSTIRGDKIIFVDDNYNISMKNIGGDFIKIIKNKYLDIQNDYNYKTAEEAFGKSDFQIAQKYYNVMLQNSDVFPLKQDDRNLIMKRINEISTIQWEGNLIGKKSPMDLDVFFISVLNSLNPVSVKRLLRDVNYKQTDSAKVDGGRIGVLYLPVCCIPNYRDNRYKFEQLQVNYRNEKPQSILYYFKDQSSGFYDSYVDAIKNKGYKIIFKGYHNIYGDGDITEDEFKKVVLKSDYENMIILSANGITYNFSSRAVVITKD